MLRDSDYPSNEESPEVFLVGKHHNQIWILERQLVVGKKVDWGGDQLQGMVKNYTQTMQKTGGIQEMGFTDSLDTDTEGSGGDQKPLNTYT